MTATDRRRFYPRVPRLISTDLSETRPDPGKPTPRWEQKRIEQQQQATGAMQVLQQLEQHLGGIFSQIKAPPMNDVIYTGARIIPASGEDILNVPVAISAYTIANLSPFQLTAGSSSGNAQSPAAGIGVKRFPPGMFRTVAARGNGVGVRGPAGASYDLTVYQRPRPEASGPCGLAQGGIVLAAGQTTSQTIQFVAGGLQHVAVVLNVSAVAGGSVQVTINGVTPSGYVYPLLNGIAVGTTGVTPYRIGPSFTPSPNAVADDLVPPVLQLVATVSGTITYGLDLVSG
jgi:hypothetical protein